MDNVFAQIKTTELKGSTFRSRILDFGDFDISEAEFKIVFKRAGNILSFPEYAPQKIDNRLVIPYNILESYSSEIRMEAWMSLNGVTDLALVDTMLISAENQLKSDATNQNISVTFGDVVIPVTFTQAIVQFGGGGTGSGEDGKSAYEIAVLNGFEGTEGEWLASLKGADGEDFTYEDFTPEQLALLKGADGKSAYQIAVDNGFEGTEPEWLASLQHSGSFKTINGESILGEGNITILTGGSADVTEVTAKVNKIEDLGIYNENIPLNKSGNYNRDTGVFSTNSSFKSTEKFKIANRKITFTGLIGSGVAANAYFFNDAGAVLGYFNKNTALTNYQFAFPEGTTQMAMSVSNANAPSVILNVRGKLLEDIESIPILKEEDKRLNGVATDGASANYYRLGVEYDEVRAMSNSNPNHYALLWMGQSNASGYALYSDLEALSIPDTLPINNFVSPVFENSMTIAPTDKWGVWWPVLKRLSEYITTKPIYFYKNAIGGTSIRTHWNPDLILSTAAVYPLYHSMAAMKKMKEILPTIKYRALVWIQGENEEFAPFNWQYQGNLKKFIAFVRGRAAQPYMPIIIVGMHPNQSHYDVVVRESQIRVCNETPNCIFIDPSSLTWSTVDGTHYDGAYNERLAPLIFEAIKNL